MNTPYRGRFAPSPTGLLHIGSLLTAVASFADARAAGGAWLVRMEDLDPPREMSGAADTILATLEAFGFEWDGSVWYQSQRDAAYEAALNQLKNEGRVYPCYCSRKDWHMAAKMGIDGPIYNGHCAHGAIQSEKTPAWRLRVADEIIAFEDRIVGMQAQNLAREIGDFVLRRADGFWAYQLAVVVDDAAQGITDVVRGQDLLVSTPRQIWLQQQLGLPTPRYAHLPLLTNDLGQKWSKQTCAPALDTRQAEALLRSILSCLGLPPAPEVNQPKDILAWAVAHWQMVRVPKENMVWQEAT